MQDRFKFRAWHNGVQEMYNVESVNCNYEACFEEKDGARGAISFDEGSKDVLMQCTGLKDKNGKLIYEGDILELPFYTVEQGQFIKIAEVVWRVDSFACNVPNEDSYSDDSYSDDSYSHDSYSLEHWIVKRDINEGCLIIGNKFENPELFSMARRKK